MKKSNKGFSMVELIIVIAIMAILAGALAPALIKYINKSRISTDIQTANTIATAIQTALANESGYDKAKDSYSKEAISTIFVDTDEFTKAFKNACGGSKAPATKAKKCMAGTAVDGDKEFHFDLNKTTSEIKIYAGDGQHILYPSASECLTNDEVGETCKLDPPTAGGSKPSAGGSEADS